MNSSIDKSSTSLTPHASRLRSATTFCIKTIHRPHCCATLVRSIYEHCGEDRLLIYVLNDGRPDLRFSQTCPDEAAMVDRLIETGEYRRIGNIAGCAFVCNCFVAYRDVLQVIRWDEDLKVDELWDFFWRAKVATAQECHRIQ